MPTARTFDTPYGTVRIAAVRDGRVWFDAFTPPYKLTVNGTDYAVSLCLTKVDGEWQIGAEADRSAQPDARLRFVCRPSATRLDPGTDLPAGSPIRQGVINQIVPRVTTWCDDQANRTDFLVSERDTLLREIASATEDETRAEEAYTIAHAYKTECQAKLAAVLAALG